MKAEKKTVKHFFFDECRKEQLFEIDYVVIPLLPKEQIEEFEKYLDKFNPERPLVVEEGYYQWECASYKDYEEWYEKTFAN